MTLLFISCSINCLLHFSQNQLDLLVEKNGQKTVSQHEKTGSNHNFKKLKVFCMSNCKEDEG